MALAKAIPLSAFLFVSSLTDPVSSFSTNVNIFGVRDAVSTVSSTELMAMRRGRPRGPVRTVEVKPPMNNEIKYDELRVTVPNMSVENLGQGKRAKDEPLGIMSKADAIAKAKELGGLDLVLINENSSPPVAKIVDYSKYRYEKEKKAKELKKNSKASELKEVKMSYKIDVHDYGVRLKNASKFIKQGNRVKCTIQFRGREMQHDKLGVELLNKLAEEMSDICQLEGKPKREGRTLFSILSPKAEVTKAVNDKKRKQDKDKKKKRSESKQAKAGTKVEKDEKNDTVLSDPLLDNDTASVDELLGSADAVTNDLFA